MCYDIARGYVKFVSVFYLQRQCAAKEEKAASGEVEGI